MTDRDFSQEEIFQYSRQLMIPDIGLEGQRKLRAASVLIVGAGGLGSPAAMYLAAAGIGHLGIVDNDVVELSNLQRQILHGVGQINQPKVSSARARLSDLNPHIQVDAIRERFDQNTAMAIAAGYDILVDCSDNFNTRYLVNDLCVLTGRPDVYGAVYRFDGQVSVFDAKHGPCYRCLFPNPPSDDYVASSGNAILGVVPGVIGTLQAAEVIKLILGIGNPLIGSLMVVDMLTSQFRQIRLLKRPDCALCGDQAQLTGLKSEEATGGIKATALSDSETISPKELAELLATDNPPLLIDVREAVEIQISSIQRAVLIPLASLSAEMPKLDKNREIVVICRTGIRSENALLRLKANGFTRVKNLTGGINAWVEQIDRDQLQY